MKFQGSNLKCAHVINSQVHHDQNVIKPLLSFDHIRIIFAKIQQDSTKFEQDGHHISSRQLHTCSMFFSVYKEDAKLI